MHAVIKEVAPTIIGATRFRQRYSKGKASCEKLDNLETNTLASIVTGQMAMSGTGGSMVVPKPADPRVAKRKALFI